MTEPGQPDDGDHEIERRFREISAQITREDGAFGARGAKKLDRAARNRDSSKVRPSGAPINPYDQSAPPLTDNHCHATTGT